MILFFLDFLSFLFVSFSLKKEERKKKEKKKRRKKEKKKRRRKERKEEKIQKKIQKKKQEELFNLVGNNEVYKFLCDKSDTNFWSAVTLRNHKKIQHKEIRH